MTVLILGLGLIGASLAKTLKKNTAHCVLGWNRTPSVAQRALADGAIDATGSLEELLPQADITIINFYPEAIVPFILEHKDLFKKECGYRLLRDQNQDLSPNGSAQGSAFYFYRCPPYGRA